MKALYEDLMRLTEGEDSTFYFVDHVEPIRDTTFIQPRFRVFSYHLASYSDFLRPSALDCRGTMFYINEAGEYIGLAALPPKKFFNYRENPFTMNLDLSKVKYVMDKMDGSLMTTYALNVEFPFYIYLKSKTALHSEQAKAANAFLMRKENILLYNFLTAAYAVNGISISLEWTSPENRIVVGYQEDRLTVLCARYLHDGSAMPYDELLSLMQDYECSEYLVNVHEFESAADFIEAIPSITENIEGFVIELDDGLKMKIKTDAYSSLHRCKDSVTIPRRLYEVVVNEAHDDLRSMFATDPYVLNRIDQYEVIVKDAYKQIERGPLAFYEDNKYLDRKSFALKGQAELSKMFFNIAIGKYIGREIDLKEFLIKNYKEFGISDTETGDEDN